MIPPSRAANRDACAPGGLSSAEVACGTDPMMMGHLREFPETSFTGYDISGRSVELVNQALGEVGITNVRANVQGIAALRMTGYYDQEITLGCSRSPHQPGTYTGATGHPERDRDHRRNLCKGAGHPVARSRTR